MAEDEKSSLSIKTVAFPNGDGEISGFLTAVPEPSSFALLFFVAMGLVACRLVVRQQDFQVAELAKSFGLSCKNIRNME